MGLSEELTPSPRSDGSLGRSASSLFVRQVSPLDERHEIGPGQAALVLFKAIVGPGILFLPAGIKNAGLVSACCVTAFLGILSTWCMLLLLDASKRLRAEGRAVTTVGDIGEVAAGRAGRAVVDAAVVVSQLGFCVAYCVFVAENVQALIFEVHGGVAGTSGEGEPCGLTGFFGDKMLVYYIILILVPLLIPFTWVRQIRYFTCTNIIASTLVIVSVIYMMVSFAFELSRPKVMDLSEELKLFDPSGTMVYFGTAMYAFEGISVLLPTERCMRDPDKLPRVVCLTMGGSCLLQLLFGGSAYILYGPRTRSVITVSLSDGSALWGMPAVELVQLAWVLEVLLTLPLQLFPAARLLEPLCMRRNFRSRNSGRKWSKNAIRAGLLFGCMAVALGGYRSVDNLVALIGALGCVPLAVVYPALFHMRVASAGRARGRPRAPSEGQLEDEAGLPESPAHAAQGKLGGVVSDALIVAFGCASVVMAVVLAIKAWIESSFVLKECVRRS